MKTKEIKRADKLIRNLPYLKGSDQVKVLSAINKATPTILANVDETGETGGFFWMPFLWAIGKWAASAIAAKALDAVMKKIRGKGLFGSIVSTIKLITRVIRNTKLRAALIARMKKIHGTKRPTPKIGKKSEFVQKRRDYYQKLLAESIVKEKHRKAKVKAAGKLYFPMNYGMEIKRKLDKYMKSIGKGLVQPGNGLVQPGNGFQMGGRLVEEVIEAPAIAFHNQNRRLLVRDHTILSDYLNNEYLDTSEEYML